MTTSNFRQAAIAKLKEFRANGYTLHIDLRASSAAMKAELSRIHGIICEQIEAVNAELQAEDSFYDACQPEPVEEISEDDAVMAFYDCLPAAEAAAERLDVAAIPVAAEVVTETDDIKARRAAAAARLGLHLAKLCALTIVLVALVVRLPIVWADERLRAAEAKAFLKMPLLVIALVMLGDRAREIDYPAVGRSVAAVVRLMAAGLFRAGKAVFAVDYVGVMDKVFCLV